mgnify:CR=1 FL=1
MSLGAGGAGGGGGVGGRAGGAGGWWAGGPARPGPAGAEEGAGDGVQDGVGVGVSGQAAGLGDAHAAENQGAIGGEWMNVDALADPDHDRLHCWR